MAGDARITIAFRLRLGNRARGVRRPMRSKHGAAAAVALQVELELGQCCRLEMGQCEILNR